MYLLYPRLPLAVAEKLAHDYERASIEDLILESNLTHPTVLYAPTGGNKVGDSQLTKLQKQIRDCAKQHGYPDNSSEDGSRAFDMRCGILLHQSMFIHPSEASHREVWAFLTCVLLPDVVRWRFIGETTSRERFIGSDRGLRRNTFGRLWWRAFLLNQPLREDPYILLRELVEDDLVQVTERNSIAANPVLLVSFCEAFLSAVKQYNLPRRLMMREASKRVRRLLSIIAFDALDPTAIEAILIDVFVKTATSLSIGNE